MKQFRGNVEGHPHIQGLLKLDPDTNEYLNDTGLAFDIFKDYWTLGYDPEVGRDTYLSKPKDAKESAVHRIHLRPVTFTGKEKDEFGYTASKKCWDNWENAAYIPSRDSNSGDIPTSNEWVVYCVDHQRNACMLAYLPASLDAHAYCENMDNMNRLVQMANEWYELKMSFPMEVAELPLVFDDKWLVVE